MQAGRQRRCQLVIAGVMQVDPGVFWHCRTSRWLPALVVAQCLGENQLPHPAKAVGRCAWSLTKWLAVSDPRPDGSISDLATVGVACQPLTFGYGNNLEGFLLRNLEVATSAGLRDDRWSLRLDWQRWNSNTYRSTEDG